VEQDCGRRPQGRLPVIIAAKMGMVMHACNPGAQKAEAREWRVQGRLGYIARYYCLRITITILIIIATAY
jgi:hypothetical protein